MGTAWDGPRAGGWDTPTDVAGYWMPSRMAWLEEMAQFRLGCTTYENNVTIQQILSGAYYVPGNMSGSEDAELSEQGAAQCGHGGRQSVAVVSRVFG